MRKSLERLEIILSLAAFIVSFILIFAVFIPAISFGETTFLQIVFGFMVSTYLWLCLMTIFYPIWSLIKKLLMQERKKENVSKNSTQS